MLLNIPDGALEQPPGLGIGAFITAVFGAWVFGLLVGVLCTLKYPTLLCSSDSVIVPSNVDLDAQPSAVSASREPEH